MISTLVLVLIKHEKGHDCTYAHTVYWMFDNILSPQNVFISIRICVHLELHFENLCVRVELFLVWMSLWWFIKWLNIWFRAFWMKFRATKKLSSDSFLRVTYSEKGLIWYFTSISIQKYWIIILFFPFFKNNFVACWKLRDSLYQHN